MAVVATSVPVVLECIVGYLVREKAPTGEPRGPVNFTASPPRIGRPLMPDPAGISLTAVTVSNLSRHRGQHALFRPPPPIIHVIAAEVALCAARSSCSSVRAPCPTTSSIDARTHETCRSSMPRNRSGLPAAAAARRAASTVRPGAVPAATRRRLVFLGHVATLRIDVCAQRYGCALTRETAVRAITLATFRARVRPVVGVERVRRRPRAFGEGLQGYQMPRNPENLGGVGGVQRRCWSRVVVEVDRLLSGRR